MHGCLLDKGVLFPQYEGIQYKIKSRRQEETVDGEKSEVEGPAR